MLCMLALLSSVLLDASYQCAAAAAKKSIELALSKDAAVAVGPEYIAFAGLQLFATVRPEFTRSPPVHSSS